MRIFPKEDNLYPASLTLDGRTLSYLFKIDNAENLYQRQTIVATVILKLLIIVECLTNIIDMGGSSSIRIIPFKFSTSWRNLMVTNRAWYDCLMKMMELGGLGWDFVIESGGEVGPTPTFHNTPTSTITCYPKKGHTKLKV